MNDKALISVVIPAYNEGAWILPTIQSVRDSFNQLKISNYEIVVCDNNSSDTTGDLARRAGCRVVFEKHNQIARARNSGAKASRGDWLIFLDADTLVNPKLLKATLETFESAQYVGGGSLLKLDSEKVGVLVNILLPIWNHYSAIARYAPGSYLFCLRQAWQELGGFDEAYYAGEELDFSIKLKKWAKRNRLKFKVITTSPAVTSARKIQWFGPWSLTWKMVKLNVPGALKNQDWCDLWYKRPTPIQPLKSPLP